MKSPDLFDPQQSHLKVHHLRLTKGRTLWGQAKVLVKEITFSVEAGEWIHIIGAPGSGKSLLATKILTGGPKNKVIQLNRTRHRLRKIQMIRCHEVPLSTQKAGVYVQKSARKHLGKNLELERLEQLFAKWGLSGKVGQRLERLSRQQYLLLQWLIAELSLPDFLIIDEGLATLPLKYLKKIQELIIETLARRGSVLSLSINPIIGFAIQPLRNYQMEDGRFESFNIEDTEHTKSRTASEDLSLVKKMRPVLAPAVRTNRIKNGGPKITVAAVTKEAIEELQRDLRLPTLRAMQQRDFQFCIETQDEMDAQLWLRALVKAGCLVSSFDSGFHSAKTEASSTL